MSVSASVSVRGSRRHPVFVFGFLDLLLANHRRIENDNDNDNEHETMGA
jgi:hypothetical protein